MKQKKVLFLANHFITLYNFRKELIKEIASKNKVYISIPKSSENIYFKELGCELIETDVERRSKNPFKDFLLILQYIKIMKKINPDIIFSYTIKPNIYGSIAANLTKNKQVSNITGTGATFLDRNFTSRFVEVLYKLSIKHSYKIFFQNKGDLNFFKKQNMVKNNYELIPGSGVNLNEFKYINMNKLNSKETNFIFIGRIMQVKGIEEFLQAAKEIKETYPNVNFFVAGFIEEKKYSSIIDKYHSENIINYIGFQKNIKEWIAKMHCTVLPSHGGEGIPNVLLESAAMGKACIASNIEGSSEVIEEGSNGYLFNVKNYKSLKQKMIQFINLSEIDKNKMGSNGRIKVESKFDRNFIIEKYLNEIHLLERKGEKV